MVTEHGTLFFFLYLLLFLFKGNCCVYKQICFAKCVLDTCHDQVIIVIFQKKREDVSRYAYFRCSFRSPVCIDCQSNKRGMACSLCET